VNFRNIKVWSCLKAVRLFSTVDKNPALRCGEQERSPADLPAASEGGNPYPLIFCYDITVNSSANLFQKFFPLLVCGTQILSDLFYRAALNGRCPDNLGRPPDLTGDITKGRSVFPDYNARFFGLNEDFTRVSLEKYI